jgi:type III secretion protein O
VNDVVARIVDVKVLREDRAAEEVRRCRYTLEEAARQLERCKDDLVGYRTWRVRREGELYDGIEGRRVHLRDLEELKEDIGLLRGREHLFEQKVSDAETARLSAHDGLAAAEKVQMEAMRARQKFEELSDFLEAEARAYRERLEELELEEQFSAGVVDAEGRLE